MTDTDGDPTTGPGETSPDYDQWKTTLREEQVLVGQHCPDCAHETAAPKAACARCGARRLETVRFPTEGTVYATTTIHVAPDGFEGPYDVALIDLGEARTLGRVRDDTEIGDRVAVVDVFESDEGPAPVFAPADV
jgi:hypothetical protein